MRSEIWIKQRYREREWLHGQLHKRTICSMYDSLGRSRAGESSPEKTQGRG